MNNIKLLLVSILLFSMSCGKEPGGCGKKRKTEETPSEVQYFPEIEGITTQQNMEEPLLSLDKHGVPVDYYEINKEEPVEKEIEQLFTETATNYPFKIYGTDLETDKIIVNYSIPVTKSLLIEDKIKYLAEKVSEIQFHLLPIELLSIEKHNNRSIANINLVEKYYPNKPSWKGGYFEGTAGGRFTTVTLLKTFLQEDYPGAWIDGVEFYYDGKPIPEDVFAHIRLLKEIQYRKKP